MSELRELTDGVWLASDPVRIVGTRLTATMAVLRLRDGLLVYSPVSLTPERRGAVERLGRVAHLYAPSLFHHMFAGEWAAAFPSARLHAPAALAKKRRDLTIQRTLGGAAEPDFAGIVDEHHVDGFRLDETDLYYRPARTLVVADLVHNIGTPPGWWTRRYATMMGFYDRIALSKMLRAVGFSDRAAARRSLDAILAQPFERIVVGHGEPITADARATLTNAYSWLK